MDKMHLIGSTTRYIAGRHGVQTVYWRKSDAGKGLMKTTKTCLFNKPEGKVNTGEMFAKIRDRYSS
ncbi:hypothetical protein JYU34_017650 [Plutella xylostella]|uniref:Uncharacterized protein n=1 Tax=Plutella xylostella TaxID=51655 RepID=A0ABQ7Q310_PLUXY|nr:hypothetical protein JYU34_017650 [Plutella xylostella]